MPRNSAPSNPRATGYSADRDQAAAAWESARQAKRSATVALWAVVAAVVVGSASALVPVATQGLRDQQSYAAALDDEVDRASGWVLAGIQVSNDHLSTEVASSVSGRPAAAQRDPALQYQWQRRMAEARQRLESLAAGPAPPGDLRDLRRIEAVQIEQIQSYVDAAEGRLVGSDDGQLTNLIDVTSKGLAIQINRIERGRGRPPRYGADQWPLVDRATAARNAPAQLQRWLHDYRETEPAPGG
jgi:hypothetical protein